jgi:hypothetical protein
MFLAPHSMHTLLTLTKNYLTKADDIFRGHDVITHAQTIMGDGVITVSPHDFGIHHTGITKYRKLICTIID